MRDSRTKFYLQLHMVHPELVFFSMMNGYNYEEPANAFCVAFRRRVWELYMFV